MRIFFLCVFVHAKQTSKREIKQACMQVLDIIVYWVSATIIRHIISYISWDLGFLS